MGNNANICACGADTLPPTPLRQMSSTDDFIIHYSHDQITKQKDQKIDIESLDTRRIVFVSAMGLYQTWTRCPSVVLYAALLLMPLKRVWVYNPSRHREHISSFGGDIDAEETKRFLQMLRWKDSQGLVSWMLDEYPTAAEEETYPIHPIWKALNETLQRLYDPITCEPYHAISLDAKWWKSDDYKSEYEVESAEIVTEMCQPSLKFNRVQEMVYQSNPLSLVPLVKYSVEKESKCKWHNHSENDENWCISDEYISM